ncbi:hypothetical protein PPACK8108_LOCUS7209 [Phakopsora pachyrhizi]|uniref:Uncharacterized protein n=1 Tax=Phakopsora pachyrhizi TaxID=170000 RepID=A0AAV0AV48_PHAPC|nr:hypothetical protein PPACK8108_LOCUS7209 [Phakopsora pachyrhizi]
MTKMVLPPQEYQDCAGTILDAFSAYQRRMAMPWVKNCLSSQENPTKDEKSFIPKSHLSYHTATAMRSFNCSSKPSRKIPPGSEFFRNTHGSSLVNGYADTESNNPSEGEHRYQDRLGPRDQDSLSYSKKTDNLGEQINKSAGSVKQPSSKLLDPRAKAYYHPRENHGKKWQSVLLHAQGTGHSLKPVLQDGIKPKRNPTQGSTGDACQLFDPQKHNTVKFSALKRNGKRKLQPVMLINPDSNTQSKAIRKCFYEHDQNSNSQQALVDGQKTNLLGIFQELSELIPEIMGLQSQLRGAILPNWNVFDLGNPLPSSSFYQLDVNNFVTDLFISSSGEGIAYTEAGGMLHLWTTLGGTGLRVMAEEEGDLKPMKWSQASQPIEFAPPKIDWKNETPLSSIGMPYYSTKLLSVFSYKNYLTE